MVVEIYSSRCCCHMGKGRGGSGAGGHLCTLDTSSLFGTTHMNILHVSSKKQVILNLVVVFFFFL